MGLIVGLLAKFIMPGKDPGQFTGKAKEKQPLFCFIRNSY
jgi:hypothetical protein